MASSRKKQDEKHLKILRNLVSLHGNKQCFDCNQRGPTYVNVTIGSFVCTTCSGLLRGLTPPHRVKSILMATFTAEEIESLQSKGNEYCRKVWLALYDADNIQNTKDENFVRDFMVAKYEKKLYYLEPSPFLKNGSSFSGPPIPGTGVDNFKVHSSVPISSLATSPQPNSKYIQSHSNASNGIHVVLPDPFRVIQKQDPVPQKHEFQQQIQQSQPAIQEASFANFENNPIFNSSTISSSSSFPPLKQNTTIEDKYAALKDLDCLMKMQQDSPQNQGFNGNGWSPNNLEKSSSLNPFQPDIGNNNIVNPFRSGLIQQMDKTLNNNINCGTDSIGTYSLSGNNSSSCSSQNSPWEANNLWSYNTSPINQSFIFSAANGSGKSDSSGLQGNSNNPFL